MKLIYLLTLLFSLITCTSAQNRNEVKPGDYLKMKWKKVSNGMPSEWYGSEEAQLAAENILIYQKDAGGWQKNRNFHREISESKKSDIIKSKSNVGATFDNGATIRELRFLARIYSNHKDERYKQAFEKGLEYILISQYENGGWPQFYPYKGGYANHITYNDNAMVNVMEFLKDVFSDNKEFVSLQINSELKAKAIKAFDKGLECILKTQIVVDGKPTVWCAQHDEITLAPAKARSYELESFSGAESVGIVLLLMDIEKPSEEIIAAVNGAVEWFEDNKLEGIKLEKIKNEDGKRDRIVVEDTTAPPLWGRFYDLETGKPFFCSRDGIKKNTLAEISHNRRNSYSWYTDSPGEVLKQYPEWKKKYK